MSRIRSKNTKPEKLIRSLLHKAGYRFRINKSSLPGKPDIIFPKYGLAVLVHGCFWHQHKDCIDGRIPKSNTAYWEEKLNKNVQRDRKNKRKLNELGWKVVVVWECEVINNSEKALAKIISKIKTVV